MPRILRTVILILAAALLLFAISSDARAGNKIGLGQIVKEAKKPKSEQKVVRKEPSQTKHKARVEPSPPPPPSYGPRTVGYVEYEPIYYPPPPEVYPVRHSYYYGGGQPRRFPMVRPRIGVVGGGGALATDLIDGYATAGVLLGVLIDQVSIDLRGYYSRPQFTPDVSGAFGEIESFAGDLALRFHLVPFRARAGANLMVTGRLGHYGWTYRNPVDVEDEYGLRTLTSDSMKFRALLFGVGIEPFRTPGFSFSITAAAGYQRFDDTTRRGFDNDLFENGRVYEALVEIVVSP